jgi:hypothetical protein
MDGNQTPAGQPELPQPIQPGQTIAPGATQVGAATPVPPVSNVPAAAPQPVAPPEMALAQSTIPEPVPFAPAPSAANTDFQPAPEAESDEYPTFPDQPVSWTASEFIAHEKSLNWYVLLFGGAVIAAGLAWLLFKDILAAVVILVAVLMLAAYSKRQPRELAYTLDNSGITIGQKLYPYALFRSFGVVDDGAFSSIELIPLKRFSPPITIYFDPDNEDAIADALTPHVPFVPRKPDPIDQLIRRIRF